MESGSKNWPLIWTAIWIAFGPMCAIEADSLSLSLSLSLWRVKCQSRKANFLCDRVSPLSLSLSRLRNGSAITKVQIEFKKRVLDFWIRSDRLDCFSNKVRAPKFSNRTFALEQSVLNTRSALAGNLNQFAALNRHLAILSRKPRKFWKNEV